MQNQNLNNLRKKIDDWSDKVSDNMLSFREINVPIQYFTTYTNKIK